MTKGPRLIPEYSYSDLPADGRHIRLLKLEPGEKEDYIHCHLEPTSTADAHGTYECISYVWGTSTEVRRIIIDGHWIYITLNLFLALQHFRKPDEERTLWADALCIQQTNPPEKGRQVQLMGQIYENSLRTLVWLGLDHDRIAVETTDFLKETSAVARSLCEKYGGVTKIPILSHEENPVSQDKRKWDFFQTFLGFAWFSRVWVMQEVGIAPDVSIHWGDAEIRLSDVVNVNELARHAPHLFKVLPLSWNLHDVFLGVYMTYGNKNTWRDQVVPDFITQGFKLVPNNSCIDILLQSSKRNASDKRDHIYALLGHPLILVNGDTIVQADYERDVNDVYMEVSTKLLQNVEPSLSLAVAGCMGKRKARDLDSAQPSWVVHWELGSETANLGRPDQWYYAGGKDASADIEIDDAAKTLTLPAVIMDDIVWASDQIPASEVQIDDIIHAPKRHVAMEWVWDALPSEPCRYTGKHGSRDAFTLSLVGGRYKHRGKAEDDLGRHRRLANAYLDYVKSHHSGGKGDESLRSDARDFENDHAVTANERRFIVTEKGFYGLGSQLTQEGDVVAVFPGLRVPYVLRPTGDMYKLVGAAYVHGVMCGELLDEKDPLSLGVGKPKNVVIA